MYKEIKDKSPEMVKCFFAFDNQQFAENKEKAKIQEDEKIYQCNSGSGLFGTKEGIRGFWKFYDDQAVEIAEKCDPQEVYNHEYWNHECDYTGNDERAIKIVIDYFGTERAKEVKRKYGYFDIDDYGKQS